jgi:hypothetical protein
MKTARWWGVLACLALWPSAAAAGGWYLLVPPVLKDEADGSLVVGLNAPLHAWTQYGAYDSAAECERVAERVHGMPGVVLSGVALWAWARCVASEDPRLR